MQLRNSRCAILAAVLVLAACSDSTGPKPAPIDHPPAQLGPWESYAMAPCVAAIDRDLKAWEPDYGEPVSITVTTDGDTTTVRVSLDAPAEWSDWYDGVVWQTYYWLPDWGYCMSTASGGMPDQPRQ